MTEQSEQPADLATIEREYALIAANKLSLDLSRGKPAADQLQLSAGLEDTIGGDYRSADGTDVRNYGALRGIVEARELGAQLLDAPVSAVIAGGNSSLALMHLTVATALNSGLWQDTRRWGNAERPGVLAPVPGYDRHFTLSAALGLDMHPIPMTPTGPDMQAAAERIREDANIKGIWCVPKYSNPTGATCDADTVRAMAELPKLAAADDFVVLWDNAYAVHDLTFPGDELASIHAAAEAAGTAEHVVQFASTSKITFAGAGVAFLAAGPQVLDALEAAMSVMTIGPDKVNQLRHARFLKDHLPALMREHAALLAPKFDIVLDTLERELQGWGATWSKPKGGYFVSLDLAPGLATEVVKLAKAIGLTLTPAGATWPHGQDPANSNVRIAPTFATREDLKAAMHILAVCVKLATLRQRDNPSTI